MTLADFADLHTHTTASDGLDEPTALVARAQAVGLAAIAITDHDTLDAHHALLAAGSHAVRIIPGIEMSANIGAAEVHTLGYFIEPTSQYLAEALATLRAQRLRRMEKFCVRLTALGLPITFEEVLAHATGESVGRPHVARAMIDRGYVGTVSEAFDRYLAGGRSAFVPREDITPESSIDLIHQSGGVAVLAHPFTAGDPEAMIDHLTSVGLDGVEVEYGAYDEEQRATLRSLAAARSLISTGGSDFHGVEHRENVQLGSGRVPLATVDQLYERSGRYR